MMFKTVLVLVAAAVCVSANPVEKCTHQKHLTMAQGMCQSHGVANKQVACVCTESMPICLQADLEGLSKPESCNPKQHEACVGSCASGVLAVKCEGVSAATCMTVDPAIKQRLAEFGL